MVRCTVCYTEKRKKKREVRIRKVLLKALGRGGVGIKYSRIK
jgi:hypothetical protein